MSIISNMKHEEFEILKFLLIWKYIRSFILIYICRDKFMLKVKYNVE